MFKFLFAFLFFGFVAKLFMFRRFAHHRGQSAEWHGRREEMRARMEERLSEWHDHAHGDKEPEADPTTT